MVHEREGTRRTRSASAWPRVLSPLFAATSPVCAQAFGCARAAVITPPSMKPSPPNMATSVRSGCPLKEERIRSANSTSYGMAVIVADACDSGPMSGTMSPMPSAAQWLAFVATSFVIVAIPGPSQLFIMGRAFAGGRRAALLSVLGNAAGVYVQVVAVAVGLGALIAASSTAYSIIRVVGGLYLVWLGISAIRERRALREALSAGQLLPTSTRSSFGQAVLVGLTNPKVLVAFAALLPPFVNPSGIYWVQMMALGLVFVVIAILGDGLVAVAASQAREWFVTDPRRAERMSVAGGTILAGLGCFVVLTARR